jgi:CYTH domain-containing protein
MEIEKEQKFYLKNNSWEKLVYKKEKITQFYISPRSAEQEVRVRLVDSINHGFLQTINHKYRNAFITIKLDNGLDLNQRKEFEYSIPYKDAEELLRSSFKTPIIKTRNYLDLNYLSIGGFSSCLITVDQYTKDDISFDILEIEYKKDKELKKFEELNLDFIYKKVEGKENLNIFRNRSIFNYYQNNKIFELKKSKLAQKIIVNGPKTMIKLLEKNLIPFGYKDSETIYNLDDTADLSGNMYIMIDRFNLSYTYNFTYNYLEDFLFDILVKSDFKILEELIKYNEN